MTTTQVPIEVSADKVKQKRAKKIPQLTRKQIWDTLSAIDVGEHLEMRGDYPYLPWATAKSIMMEHFPEFWHKNHLNEKEYPAFYDHQERAMVRVTVYIGEFDETEDYMVTDNKNNAIENPDPSDINDALKRAFVKSCASFGLGEYLYRGEKFPRSTLIQKVDVILSEASQEDFEALVKWAKTKFADMMTDSQLKLIIDRKGGSE